MKQASRTGSGAHAWRWMYPPLQCHAQGWLDVGQGHEIYWEVCGNPLGAPALFVHGGPGAGCAPADRRWFDPRHYRIVLFDQRGAGRSRPQGEVLGNSTEHLVGDIETLRRHLNVDRWLLLGGSWGATLALAYAQCHPGRVLGLVLRGVFTATRGESRWLYTQQGAALVCPAAWQRLMESVPAARDGDALAALAVSLNCGEPAIEQAAAQAWLRWEQDLMDFEALQARPAAAAMPAQHSGAEAAAALAAARIGVHYAQHDFFLGEGQLLQGAPRLSAVRGVIVQGGRDRVTPPAAATALHRAWPGSRLVLVPAAGHASTQGDMAKHLIEATDDFRHTRSTMMEISDEQEQVQQ